MEKNIKITSKKSSVNRFALDFRQSFQGIWMFWNWGTHTARARERKKQRYKSELISNRIHENWKSNTELESLTSTKATKQNNSNYKAKHTLSIQWEKEEEENTRKKHAECHIQTYNLLYKPPKSGCFFSDCSFSIIIAHKNIMFAMRSSYSCV